MKTTLLLIVGILVTIISFSQNRKKIQRSWIKTTITNLTGSEPQVETDTLYIRYTFDGPNLYLSFYPAWDTYKQEWSINGDQLIIGIGTYTIESLTDTSLTIVQPGFKRLEFVAEEYISSQDKNLVTLGEYNGKPLYQANRFFTPRYSKHTSFSYMLTEGLEMNNLSQPEKFLATFVVTEEGKIENVQLVKGISSGYDNTILERIQKSSKSWKPAYYKGKPIQTQLLYEIKYLPSLRIGSPINRPAIKN